MSLSDVKGQDKAVRILSGMIDRGRIATSYLFVGPSGVGRKYTAFQFIKALNCTENRDNRSFESCDKCNACRKTDSLIHPDMKVVSPDEGTIKIEEIRVLSSFLSLTPNEGLKKIVIIEDADTMTQGAGNAFLKTLEEPPTDSVLILLTCHENAILDTIRSRCVKILFVPLSLEAVTSILKDKSLSMNEAQIRLSGGSIEALLSGGILKAQEESFRLFTSMIRGDKITAWKTREEMKEWLDTALSIIRDIVILKVCNDEKFLLNINKTKEITALSSNVRTETLLECYKKISDIKTRITFNLNKGIVLNYMQSLLKVVF